MTVRNRLQLFRTSTPGAAPALADLLIGELSVNLSDKDLYLSTGEEVVNLTAASNLKTDASHRFVTDTQIAAFGAVASKAGLGLMQVGSNLDVDTQGVVSLKVATALQAGVLSAADFTAFAGKQNALTFTPLDVAGGTMAGPLVLNGGPTQDNDATNKSYVDTLSAAAVQKVGDTMSGLLVLSADPAQGLGAATKQYVDNKVSLIGGGTFDAPVQALADLAALPSAGLEDKHLRLVEDAGSIFHYDAQSVVAADGAGVIAPTDIGAGAGRWIKMQAATQNHEALVGLLGGAENDHLHLTTAEKNSYDGHIADTALHLTTQQSTFLGALNVTAVELNYMSGVTSAVQTQLNGKQDSLGFTPVNVAGDTLTGPLLLAGDPTEALNPVSLQFLQSYVLDCGTF